MSLCLPSLEPIALLHGENARLAVAAGQAHWLAGGPTAFALARIGDEIVPASRLPAAELARLIKAPDWANLPPGPAIMGVLNLTPDSFSDGGRFSDPAEAVAAALAMVAAGAAIIDVGGESTRPGADPISTVEEIRRIGPVIRALAAQSVTVSVDTRNAATMEAALAAGARIVNDVSALRHDPDAAAILAQSAAPVILMHSRDTPRTMTARAAYADIAAEVAVELAERIAYASGAGIDPARIAIDPGIGFGKTGAHNLQLLPRLAGLLPLGRPLVVGVSRKAFIGRLSGVPTPVDRDAGSLAAGLHAVLHGARVLRVHDVAQTARALRVWCALTDRA